MLITKEFTIAKIDRTLLDSGTNKREALLDRTHHDSDMLELIYIHHIHQIVTFGNSVGCKLYRQDRRICSIL